MTEDRTLSVKEGRTDSGTLLVVDPKGLMIGGVQDFGEGWRPQHIHALKEWQQLMRHQRKRTEARSWHIGEKLKCKWNFD